MNPFNLNICGLENSGKGPRTFFSAQQRDNCRQWSATWDVQSEDLPGNICFSRPGLGLKSIKSTSVCAHKCNEGFEEGYRKGSIKYSDFNLFFFVYYRSIETLIQ